MRRINQRLGWQTVECPVGTVAAVESNAGIVLLTWCDAADNGLDTIRRRLGGDSARFHRTSSIQSVEQIERFFEHRGDVAPPALDESGTDFQRRVWRALRAVPAGSVRTYKEIAQTIGRPTAARAVAGACGANPVSLFTPCHRIVAAGGGLGGYGGGVAVKRALLDMERRE